MNPTEHLRVVDAAKDDIEFLVSSWNRFDVLDAIAGEPQTRNELKAQIDVSRVTLSRILADLEARDWIVRANDHYEVTDTGALIATELGRVVANLQTLNQLGDDLEWIRHEQFDFDLFHLRDAELITPTWDDFSIQTRRIIELALSCSRIRGISTGIDREFFEMLSEAAANDDIEQELLLPPKVVDKIVSETELRRTFLGIADAPNATIYRYDGDRPLMMLGILDMNEPAEVAMMCGYHEEGAPPGTLKSIDPTVRTWAVEYFEARRAESAPLSPAVFTP